MKDFFGNTLQSFLTTDLQGLRKWGTQQEIPQPGYAPGAIRMTPTVAEGVDAIVATLDVRALYICIADTDQLASALSSKLCSAALSTLQSRLFAHARMYTWQRMKRDDTFAKRLQVNADKLDDVLEHFDRLQRSIKVGQSIDATLLQCIRLRYCVNAETGCKAGEYSRREQNQKGAIEREKLLEASAHARAYREQRDSPHRRRHRESQEDSGQINQASVPQTR